jgi:Neuraminidase (sialidase)
MCLFKQWYADCTTFLVIMMGLSLISCSKKEKVVIDKSEPKTVLKLSPSHNNPRNSEGDFISLKDGRIMFVYTHFIGESLSDHAPAVLASRYSDDGGNTWSEEDEFIVPNEGGMNVMSVSSLRLQNGDIALFYLLKNSTIDCIPLMRISKDEAKSWSDAIPIIADKKGYFVLNNDRVIQLKDGRLLLAVALHNTPEGEWNSQGDLYSYYSDDNGQTWSSSSKVPNTTDIITQEPGLIELKGGRIMMYIRASGGFQQLSYSSDRGETWSHIEASNIPSPLSPATIEKIPGTEEWLLVWNNNDGTNPDIKGKRTPLTTAISKDEGKTWDNIQDIQDDPDGWYCYVAVYFIDEANILLGYCAGNNTKGNGLAVTDITHLNRSWLFK